MALLGLQSQLGPLAESEIQDVFLQGSQELANYMNYSYFGIPTYEPEDLNELFQVYSGMGDAKLTAPGEKYAETEIQPVGTVTVNPKKYTQSIAITEESLRFGREWPDVLNRTRGLARTLHRKMDRKWTDVFLTAFNTTHYTVYDGGPLISSSHPLTLTGGTDSNYLDTDPPLTYKSFNEAVTRLEELKLDNGELMEPGHELMIVCGPQNREMATQIANSHYQPDTANNNINKNYNVGVVIDRRFSQDSSFSQYWFLVDKGRLQNPEMPGVYMDVGWMPRLTEDTQSSVGVGAFYGSVNFNFRTVDWRWIVGSAPSP